MYKLKEGVELPKEFKIKVNKKQSEALQNHLFSIGKEWSLNGKQLKQYVEKNHYLFCHIHKNIGYGIDKKRFNEYNYPRIKFKDYFEKVAELTYTESSKKEERINNSKITSFPEKWCIEVTQDNYKELDVYLHRNWKDYEGYKDVWSVIKQGLGMYFHSTSVGLFPIHSHYLRCDGYELITTEQFRKQFGKLVVHEVEFVTNDTENTEIYKGMGKGWFDENKDLKEENQRLHNLCQLNVVQQDSDRDTIKNLNSKIVELKNIIAENNVTISKQRQDIEFEEGRTKRLKQLISDYNNLKEQIKNVMGI